MAFSKAYGISSLRFTRGWGGRMEFGKGIDKMVMMTITMMTMTMMIPSEESLDNFLPLIFPHV